jgi:hypothetical protein
MTGKGTLSRVARFTSGTLDSRAKRSRDGPRRSGEEPC